MRIYPSRPITIDFTWALHLAKAGPVFTCFTITSSAGVIARKTWRSGSPLSPSWMNTPSTLTLGTMPGYFRLSSSLCTRWRGNNRALSCMFVQLLVALVMERVNGIWSLHSSSGIITMTKFVRGKKKRVCIGGGQPGNSFPEEMSDKAFHNKVLIMFVFKLEQRDCWRANFEAGILKSILVHVLKWLLRQISCYAFKHVEYRH